MENELTHVQAVRPVNKESLDSVFDSTPAPKIMHFDCHVDPTTKKGFVLWDDIRLVFPDALYVRHQTKVVPFMKGIDFMPLQPLRIAATPDVVLDVVVDGSLARAEAAISQVSSQSTVQDTVKEKSVQEEATVQKEVSTKSTIAATITEVKTATIRRNPSYGHEDTAMGNYSHIHNPAFGPQFRAPQYIPSLDDDCSNDDESTHSLVLIHEQLASNNPSIDIKPCQAPQDHTAAVSVTDVSRIVVKDISPIFAKAILGDINSQVELGNMYKVGDGVEQDYEAARYWYLKAANQEHASAQCSVGDLYRLGLGVDFNHSTALGWYQKAADQGDASGQYNLGFMYEFGLVVEMDYAAAMYWYRKSADQGYALAQFSIGDLYCDGLGVPIDYSEAMEWFLLAAKQDHSLANHGVGMMYLQGQGVAMDKDIALEWFHRAISRRDTDVWAQYSMANLYFEGLGRSQDYSKAYEWYLKSARQGLPASLFSIGILHYVGYGVPQDYSEAMKWFRRAADQHLSDAQYAIGSMHHHGQGVPADYSLAKEWYTKAACQERPYAKEALVELHQLMDEEKGVKLKMEKDNSEASVDHTGVDNTTQRNLIVESATDVKKSSSRFKFWWD